jgi:response regulator RpfG family c-di-GMP phosphodiesterase
MLPSILLLDDEPEVLKSLKRVLHSDYHVHTFTDAISALAFFTKSPTQLVISDMQMPGMNGAEFLSEIVKINNRCKRIVLTGNADIDLAKHAINDGHISAYINKPWDNQELKETLVHLIDELKDDNKKFAVIKKLQVDNKRLSAAQLSLSSSSGEAQSEHDNTVSQLKKFKLMNSELMQLSANLVALQTRDTSGHIFRIAHQSKVLAKRLKLSDVVCVQIYIACLFYRVGIPSLAPALIERPWFQMSQQERHAWMKYPQASADILSTTEALKSSAVIVRHIFEYTNGKGIPEQYSGEDIPIGSRLLSIVIHYDILISGEITGKRLSPEDAFILMKKDVGTIFDVTVFNLFKQVLENPHPDELLEIPQSLNQLLPGMILAQDVMSYEQHKLLCEGAILTESNINGLVSHQEQTEHTIIAYIHNKKTL